MLLPVLVFGWTLAMFSESDARLTVVIGSKQKIAATFGYRSVNETVVPEVEAALKAALKP